MLPSFHLIMTEKVLNLTFISPLNQTIPCEKPILHSQPQNESMLGKAWGNHTNFYQTASFFFSLRKSQVFELT
jgi:hypothetical protein